MSATALKGLGRRRVRAKFGVVMSDDHLAPDGEQRVVGGAGEGTGELGVDRGEDRCVPARSEGLPTAPLRRGREARSGLGGACPEERRGLTARARQRLSSDLQGRSGTRRGADHVLL